MATSSDLSLEEVDKRLTILHSNLLELSDTCGRLVKTTQYEFEFMSLAQAYHDEAMTLAKMMNDSPDTRYAALKSTLRNMQTIRSEANMAVISELDRASKGSLKTW